MKRIETFSQLAEIVREERKRQKLTQGEVAGLCNIGVRFMVDLEAGKKTCQIGKVLHIVNGLGIKLYAEDK